MHIPSLIIIAAATGTPTESHSIVSPPVKVDLAALVDMEFSYAPSAEVTIIDPGMLQDEAAPAPEPVYSHPAFGAMGSQRWTIQFGGGIDIDESDNTLYVGGVGYTYFIVDYLSINLELNGIHVQQIGDDPWGGNVNLLFRWHFLARDTWTMYGDAGAGMMYTSSDVPDNGSSFNFTPQAGLGFSFDIGDDNRLMTGVRWHHISNANTYDENPGRDSAMAYIGLSFPF